MQTPKKSTNISSTIGRMPAIAAPTPASATVRTSAPTVTETPGTLHSLLVASRSPPPSAIVYAVPEFICWGMPVEIKVRMQTAHSYACEAAKRWRDQERRAVAPHELPYATNREGKASSLVASSSIDLILTMVSKQQSHFQHRQR